MLNYLSGKCLQSTEAIFSSSFAVSHTVDLTAAFFSSVSVALKVISKRVHNKMPDSLVMNRDFPLSQR